jgi:hypothetical protein
MSLVWTQNTRAMLSVRTVSGVRHVRLHAMFATAPAAVLRAVSRFIQGDASARGAIDRFVAAHTAPAEVRPRPPRARGLVHDLDEILNEVSRRYFDGAVRVPIGWSRQGHARRTRGRRTIRLGVYLVHAQQIRVHPALDQRWVPRSLLAWVVFHELLHHVIPIGRSRGKRSIHSAEFRALEASFEGHAQALGWVRENLPRLLASRGVARSTRDACRSRTGAVDVQPRR